MTGEQSKPPWLDLAFKESGVKEDHGDGKENPRIIEYHSETSLKATEDELPWCSSFVCWVMEKSGIPSTRSAAARSWLNWGVKLNHPKDGAVVILWRGRKDGPSGHVGFYVGQTEDKVLLLGGNQSDMVKIDMYPKDRVLGYRWPQNG